MSRLLARVWNARTPAGFLDEYPFAMSRLTPGRFTLFLLHVFHFLDGDLLLSLSSPFF